MQTTAKVAELLQVLKDRGLNEEAVEHVKEGLLGQASEKFMTDLLGTLQEADLQSIEGVVTQEEANRKLAELYTAKTGKDIQVEMGKVVDQYATELIEKYRVG